MLAIAIGLYNMLNTQNISCREIFNFKQWNRINRCRTLNQQFNYGGYLLLSIVITISVIIAVNYFIKKQNKKDYISISSVPIYLVALFIVMVGYNLIFVKSNEFDKERKYISENIKSTQDAYDIDVEETSVDYSGTIKEEEIQKNSDVIDNITNSEQRFSCSKV